MKITCTVLAAVVLLGVSACSSSTPAAKSVSAGSSSASTVSYASNQSVSARFLSTLGGSEYGSVFAAQTGEDLVKAGRDFCAQMVSPPSPGVVEILNYSGGDEAAARFFGHLAAKSFCPEVPVSEVVNLVG